jgi:hypothetical protein
VWSGSREVTVGTATLGYPGGPAVAFRLDPELISWNWSVLTNVVETIGGRVIQVLGARLDDLTVQGSLGQDHAAGPVNGTTWHLAERFVSVITKIMEAQSADANQQGKMHPPAVFTYPPKGWRFNVYVKALTDPDGDSSVILRPAKINQRYTLSLFIVQDGSSALVKAGTTNGVFSQKAYDAVSAFMARISDGIGWHFTQYNGQVTGTLGKPGG